MKDQERSDFLAWYESYCQSDETVLRLACKAFLTRCFAETT